MRAKTKLELGQDGAKSLLDRFCGQSRCVRHRYGEARGLRHKTIEMIAGTVPWSRQTAEIPSAAIVGLKIGLWEVELQTAVRQAGGKWNQKHQLLGEVRKVLALGLTSRIEPSTLPDSGKGNMPNSRKDDLPTIRHTYLLLGRYA